MICGVGETTPAVSVLMPVFNPARYIRQSLDSILNQTFQDFEIVVVDDGSTDGSSRIIEEYAQGDARVRFHRYPRRGLVPARNATLALARAPLVACLDHDDVALPRRLELQVAFLRAHPEVVCVGGSAEMIDEADRFLTTLYPPCDDATIQKLLVQGHCAIFNSASMFRREAAMASGGYDERAPFSQDLDMWLRLGEVGKIANLPEPVLRYRLHSGGVSELHVREQNECARGACERAWARRGVQGAFKSGHPWRPSADRESQHEFSLLYGWWAFGSGEKKTAVHYSRKAIAALPWKIDGWKLLACALVKNPRKMPAPITAWGPSTTADVAGEPSVQRTD